MYNTEDAEEITIYKILELNNNDIGLIGPGNGKITRFFERFLNIEPLRIMMHSGDSM